jgi:hypothetical protein
LHRRYQSAALGLEEYPRSNSGNMIELLSRQWPSLTLVLAIATHQHL